ncbi:MAG: DUF2779 domain-containing protein [Bacteroidetes bacterium]|nr:DUF2779 domain-containing protein [Bacteroidota bacterium]
MKGLKCSRFLYLDLFHKELSDTEESSVSSKPNYGYEVEAAVYKQYFDGINVYDATKSAHELAEITIDAIKSGVPIIYQPTFMSKDGNFIFRGDLLVKGQNNYRLIEIKSSTAIKIPAHIFDVGFQKMVLDSHHHNTITDDDVTFTYSYKSRKYKDPVFRNIEVFIAHINKEYVFNVRLDLDSLIIEENVTARANRNLALINRALRTFESAIKKNKIPELNIGTHCTKPEKCTFYNYCWKDVPKKSIHRASKLSEAKIRKLAEKGITSIEDIPSNFEMSESVRTQITAELGQKEVVKKSKLKSFLEKLKNTSLIYLDFESIMPAVPVFIGTKPYQQICFQYSLIKQKEIGSPDLIRCDFLAEAGYDPRRTFYRSFIA